MKPMADTDTQVPGNEPGGDGTASPSTDATTMAPAANAGAAAPPDPMETLAREAADFKDRLLRSLAEMENLRRRADNMRRALDAFAPELRANADAGVKALIEGVELTERELLKVLEKHGVKKLEPLGAKFDPNVHQAMYE